MLYKETVEEGTLDLIQRLSQEGELKDLILVGGTSLSLQIGHRISVDIDLFSNEPIHAKRIAEHLEKKYDADNIQVITNGVFCFINDVKVDIISHQYKWLKPPLVMGNARLSSLEDIAAMKLNAITGNGTRFKDFIDIYFLLEHKSLGEMCGAFESKYPDMNVAVAKNALLYHDEIKFKEKVSLLHDDIPWKVIAKRLTEAVVNPQKIFTSLGNKESLLKKKSSKNSNKIKRIKR